MRILRNALADETAQACETEFSSFWAQMSRRQRT
jgi:hypothetical protein